MFSLMIFLKDQPQLILISLFEFLYLSSIFLANFFYFFIFYYKIKKKDILTLEILTFLTKKRTFWGNIKIMQLFVFILIPNLFFVHSRSNIFFVTVTTILLLVLASINTIFFLIYLLWIYFAVISFCFAYFYTRIDYLKKKINNFYFEGNDLEAHRIFTYFFGNMIKSALKLGTTAIGAGSAYHYKKRLEEVSSQIEAERRVLNIHQSTGGNNTTEELLILIANTKKEILNNDAIVHSFEYKSVELLKFLLKYC